jgi:hypothetical protein
MNSVRNRSAAVVAIATLLLATVALQPARADTNMHWYVRDTLDSGPADHIFAFGPGDGPPMAWEDTTDTGTRAHAAIRFNYWFYVRGIGRVAFGNRDDYALAGDWDGDGRDEFAVERQGKFYFETDYPSEPFGDQDAGTASFSAVYGNVGDTPIMGDWDGDGIDTLGVYRNGVFYLRNSNTTGYADVTFAYGNPGDYPLAGRWVDGDSSAPDTVGVYRESTFYLRNSNTSGYADNAFVYGDSDYDRYPVMARWQARATHDQVAITLTF